MRTEEEIRAEIKKLQPYLENYDTDDQLDENVLAVGAHDILLWVLQDNDAFSMSEHLSEE